MANNVIIARKMWGGTEVWFYWEKSAGRPMPSGSPNFVGTTIWARIYKSDQDDYNPKPPHDYEWYANIPLGVGQDIGDGTEVQRKCYYNDLLRYLAWNLSDLVSILNAKYRSGRWPYKAGIFTGQDVAITGTTAIYRDIDKAPCSRKCDLQITSVNVVDNFGNYDIEVFTTTSFPSSTFSLDGVTYQADNKLNVSDEGIYTVWVKDANNCIQKQTVKVATGLGAYGPRYKATIRDNDNALWTAIIEELGYEGASEPVTVSSSSGIQVKSGKSGDNKNTAIKGSECSLMLNSETNMQFLSLFTGEVNKYRFRLIEGAFRNEVEHLTENSFLTYYTWFHVDWTGDIAWETLTGNLRTTFVGSTNTTFKFFQLMPTISGLFRIKIRFKYTSTIADTMTIVVVLNDFDNDIGSGYEFEASTSTEWQTQEIEDTFGFDKLTLFAFYTGAPSATRELLIDYISIIPINEVAWSGMIAADAYEEPYMPAPYDVSFVFYDGLGKLKEIDLLNPQGDSFTGIKSQIQVVAIILAKTGLRLPINVAIDLFESKMNVGEGFTPLEQAFVNMDAFLKADGQPMDCYTSLEMLLTPYCAQVYQRDNEWWIVEVDINRTDSVNRSYDYYQFNEYGTKDSTKRTVTQLIEHTAADASTRIRFVNASQHMTVKPAYKQITIEQTTGVQITLNRNSKFADSGEDETQVFAYWTDETGLLAAKTVQEANSLVTQAYFEGDGLNTSFTKLFEAESVEVVVGAKGARIQVSINSRIVCGTSSAECKMRFKVSLGGYYLNSLGKWQTAEAFIDVVQNVNVFVKYDLTTEAIPNSGLLRIYMYQAYTSVTGVDVVGIEFKEVGVSYALIGSKIQEPNKTKLENDGFYNFVPANWKIGFGDIDHENAAYMFRNAIYTDAIGSKVSEKWYRRSYIEPIVTTIQNGDFADDLNGWTQVNEGGEDLWEVDNVGHGVHLINYFSGTDGAETTAIKPTTTNIEGFIEITIEWGLVKHADVTAVLVLYVGDKYFEYNLEATTTAYTTGTITKQIYVPANVVLKFKVYVSDASMPGTLTTMEIISMRLSNVTQPDVSDPTFLESLNGLPIQTTAAKKLLNSYIRPIQLINGSLATKNARVKMGHIFRDSYNLNGTDFAIVSLKWDVAMCENEVELCEFEQSDITDDWLLDEVGNRILDENIRALTDEG